VLSIGTSSENYSHISKKTTNTTSQHHGIFYSTRDKKWVVSPRITGTRFHLGSFVKESDAKATRNLIDSKRSEIDAMFATLDTDGDKREVLKRFVKTGVLSIDG
jgi:hypothetical protein